MTIPFFLDFSLVVPYKPTESSSLVKSLLNAVNPRKNLRMFEGVSDDYKTSPSIVVLCNMVT